MHENEDISLVYVVIRHALQHRPFIGIQTEFDGIFDRHLLRVAVAARYKRVTQCRCNRPGMQIHNGNVGAYMYYRHVKQVTSVMVVLFVYVKDRIRATRSIM